MTIEDMMRVIRMDAADFFNFKIDRLGGIYKGKQAVGMINAAGKWTLLSGQVSVGIAATARNHFAAATCTMFRPVASGVSGVFTIYPASYPEYTELENVLIGGVKVEKGYAQIPPGPGLGIELKEQAIGKFITTGKSRVLSARRSNHWRRRCGCPCSAGSEKKRFVCGHCHEGIGACGRGNNHGRGRHMCSLQSGRYTGYFFGGHPESWSRSQQCETCKDSGGQICASSV